MNKGVEMLLRRMESHPEEFADTYDPYRDRSTEGKWDSIIREVLHRVEVIDRDNGHKDASNGVHPHRYGKPLGYLSDEEILTLLAKLDETRAKVFEHRVMATLLGANETQYAANEDIYQPVAQEIMRIKADGSIGIGSTTPATALTTNALKAPY